MRIRTLSAAIVLSLSLLLISRFTLAQAVSTAALRDLEYVRRTREYVTRAQQS